MERYKWLNDRRIVLCNDCSTRSTAVTIPSDETDAHDDWHLAVEVGAEVPDGTAR